MIIARPCDFCQVEYAADSKYLKRGQGRFCSISCSTKYRHTQTPSPDPNVECALCHIKFYKKSSQRKRSKSGLYFCSKDHQIEGYRMGIVITNAKKPKRETTTKQDKINAWLAGDNSVTLTKGKNVDTKPFVKEYLILIRGDRCEQCGFSGKNPLSDRSIIQMDHQDGNCFNNDISNLKLLCPNCHAMTPTYGSLNKGSGRTHRRKAS